MCRKTPTMEEVKTEMSFCDLEVLITLFFQYIINLELSAFPFDNNSIKKPHESIKEHEQVWALRPGKFCLLFYCNFYYFGRWYAKRYLKRPIYKISHF